MDARNFDQITQRLSVAADRRTVLKGIAGAAAGTVGLIGLARSASANNIKNDAVDHDCLKRCQDHDRNRCHQRCRRK